MACPPSKPGASRCCRNIHFCLSFSGPTTPWRTTGTPPLSVRWSWGTTGAWTRLCTSFSSPRKETSALSRTPSRWCVSGSYAVVTSAVSVFSCIVTCPDVRSWQENFCYSGELGAASVPTVTQVKPVYFRAIHWLGTDCFFFVRIRFPFRPSGVCRICSSEIHPQQHGVPQTASSSSDAPQWHGEHHELQRPRLGERRLGLPVALGNASAEGGDGHDGRGEFWTAVEGGLRLFVSSGLTSAVTRTVHSVSLRRETGKYDARS